MVQEDEKEDKKDDGDTIFQLIYDFANGGASFKFMTSHPNRISIEEKAKLTSIGVILPTFV